MPLAQVILQLKLEAIQLTLITMQLVSNVAMKLAEVMAFCLNF